MKFFIVAVLIAAASANWLPKSPEELGQIRRDCIKEINVPVETVAQYKLKKYTAEGVTPCFIHCIYRKMGILDEKDGFRIRPYIKQLDAEAYVVPDMISVCYQDHLKDNPCMWMFNTYLCLKDAGLTPEGI